MNRSLQPLRPLFVLASLLLAMTSALPIGAEDDTAKESRVAWFTSLGEARKAAEKTGRPLFIALHVRPPVASPKASARMADWLTIYKDPRVVEISRQFACVARVIPAAEGQDPDTAVGVPSATHLVLDRASRVLLRRDGDAAVIGGVQGVLRLLRRGLQAFGPIPTTAPRIDPHLVAHSEQAVDGVSPSHPVSVPLAAPGVRLHLRWELPAPVLSDTEMKTAEARILMRWDGEGPFPLGGLRFESGQELDVPLDVRFAEIEGLQELATKGTHRVDLYLEPVPGSYPFSQGPLHVGRVWIDLGDGGGGGGGGSDAESESESDQPEPPQEEPQPVPEGEQDEPQPPPESKRTEVVDPFVGEGESVEKEDAVVAVEDPDGGVKPPRRVPIEDAVHEFEKQRERAVNREGISPRDRNYLQRYFESLERAVRKRAAAGQEGGK